MDDARLKVNGEEVGMLETFRFEIDRMGSLRLLK
jgi:hypothetical protein